MSISIYIMWAMWLAGVAKLMTRPKADRTKAFGLALHNAQFLVLRMPLALTGAGFVATLLPQETIAEWLGGSSGLTGIVIAAFVGVITPSGPLVSFPIALALAKSGVGAPQLMAFLTAWSVLSISYLFTWEIPLVGARWSIVRYITSLPLPILSGVLTALVTQYWPLPLQYWIYTS